MQLLTRNEPERISCDHCRKKKAVQICMAHYWNEGTEVVFCDDCADEHSTTFEDAEYALYPLANSPRAGICGYTGGLIDVEGDI